MVLTRATKNTAPKQTTPKPMDIPFVILVAVWSLRLGRYGRMKSSRMTNATEFKPVDSELYKKMPINIYQYGNDQFMKIYDFNLRAPLKTPATKRPGTPIRLPTVSITK